MILDLSHSAVPTSAAAIDESGVLCLVKRRGGINNGEGVQLRREELWEQWSAGGSFVEESRGTARAEVHEEEEGDLI